MSDLQVIAIASGKGGVGKTMLAVAIANELSRGQRTLLFDLDFFNRGLTGLFASLSSKTSQRKIEPPRVLMEGAGTTGDASSWVVSEVEKNLFVICYDDLDKRAYDLLETLDVESWPRSF